MRIEPPVSERGCRGCRAATAAPEPLEEPPATNAGSTALQQSPQAALWRSVAPSANSAMFNAPSRIAPAAARRSITVAVEAGRWTPRTFEP